MIQWANKNPLTLLIALMLITFFAADGWHVINMPPFSLHQWRQGDCVAYARNYFTKNSGLLHPTFYNLVVKDGASISEIPIIYYLSAKLYHIFGFQYWILRGLSFICYIAGIVYLYKCIRLWINEPIAALFPSVVLLTTPYLYYYGLNVLPNVPAIGLSFAGLYYLLLYDRDGKAKNIVASTVFFIFSVLLKPTDGGLLWLAYAAVVGKDMVFNRRRDGKMIAIVVSSLLIGGSLILWYKYVNYYNAINDNTLNLVGFYPIWDMSQNDILYTIRWRMWEIWASAYQHRIIMGLFVVFFVIYIIKWRSLDKFLKFCTLFLILGSAAYSVLWFKAFSDLDYYQLINVIPPTFLFITLLEYYYHKIAVKLSIKAGYAVTACLFSIMALSIYHNSDIQNRRYHGDLCVNYIPASMFKIEPYLRQLGVAPTDTLISIPDITPNVSLSACGNRGYTSFYDDIGTTLSHFKVKGVKYLVVNDTAYTRNPLFAPYLSKPIGRFENVYIYDLRQ